MIKYQQQQANSFEDLFAEETLGVKFNYKFNPETRVRYIDFTKYDPIATINTKHFEDEIIKTSFGFESVQSHQVSVHISRDINNIPVIFCNLKYVTDKYNLFNTEDKRVPKSNFPNQNSKFIIYNGIAKMIKGKAITETILRPDNVRETVINTEPMTIVRPDRKLNNKYKQQIQDEVDSLKTLDIVDPINSENIKELFPNDDDWSITKLVMDSINRNNRNLIYSSIDYNRLIELVFNDPILSHFMMLDTGNLSEWGSYVNRGNIRINAKGIKDFQKLMYHPKAMYSLDQVTLKER
jgi:hypothetical protein